jgi:hypothetical protein
MLREIEQRTTDVFLGERRERDPTPRRGAGIRGHAELVDDLFEAEELPVESEEEIFIEIGARDRGRRLRSNARVCEREAPGGAVGAPRSERDERVAAGDEVAVRRDARFVARRAGHDDLAGTVGRRLRSLLVVVVEARFHGAGLGGVAR